MLNNLKPFFTGDNSKTLMKNLDQYVNTLANNSKSYLKQNFDISNTSTSSNFVKFITRILQPFDVNKSEILKCSDDFDLLNHTNLMLSEHASSLDQIVKQNLSKAIVYKSNKNLTTSEYFLILQNQLPFKYLPIDKSLEDLIYNYPVRLVYTDSNEYSLYMVSGHLNLQKMPPSVSIFTIDILMLLFNWYKYNKHKLIKKEEISIIHFISKYVFLPLIYQQQDIIVSNMIYSLMLDIETSILFDLNTNIYDIDITHDTRFNYVKANIQKIPKDIYELVDKVIKGKTKPIQLLNSIKLPTGLSLKENILLNNDLVKYKNDMQLEWTIFVKDFNYVKFIYNLYIMYPNEQDKKAIKRVLYSIRNKCHMTKFWGYIKDKTLKDYVKNDILVQLDELVDR